MLKEEGGRRGREGGEGKEGEEEEGGVGERIRESERRYKKQNGNK